ncbi:hypothetical protein VTN77DRAFT_3505 [Rasamsonia byssochlamydoides]|uniref:uncharacterized protein n=1 Tax=Rasamsonia byssochlamydoides TaxID=89139 RepID=UPI0037433230
MFLLAASVLSILSFITAGVAQNVSTIPALLPSAVNSTKWNLAAAKADEFITVFPAGVTAAATWDRQLLYQRGAALGAEFYGKGLISRWDGYNLAFADFHLMNHFSPVCGPLGRNPLEGRNWEGFSPDPYQRRL